MFKKIILFTTLLLLLFPAFVLSQYYNNNNSYQNEVCVIVKLKIEQDVVFERQGFKAELNLTNEQVGINIMVDGHHHHLHLRHNHQALEESVCLNEEKINEKIY